MYQQLTDLIVSGRYLVVIVFAAIFPTESIIPLAGHVSPDKSTLARVIIAGTFGSTLGSTLIYALARLISIQTADAWIARYGKWLGITTRSVERSGRWFDRHAIAAVLIGRFVPGVRTAVSIPAGNRRMPLAVFLACTAAGSGAWICLLAVLGYNAQVHYETIQHAITTTANVVWIAVALTVVGLLLLRYRKYAKSSNSRRPTNNKQLH